MQHQLCASTDHSQAPNRKDEVKAATGFKSHLKTQKHFMGGRKRLNLINTRQKGYSMQVGKDNGEGKNKGNK